MVNYEEALKKPFTDLTKMVIGILLSIIPVVSWIPLGFSIECSGVGKNKPSSKMPEWKNLWDYFVKGLVASVVMFVYMLPALAVFSVAIGYAAGSIVSMLVGNGLLTTAMANNSEQISALVSQNLPAVLTTLMTVTPIALIGLVLLLIALYLTPIAVLNYMKTKNIGKAFDLQMVFKKVMTGKYLAVWIISGLVTLILKGVLVAILSPVPWLASAIAVFLSGVIAWSLFGQIFREK